jgi:hypothetical protein
VEECWQLLRQSMRSISFECLAHLPGYAAWLRGQDWTGAYRRHRRNLQLIGLPDRGRRWVLKNPSHLFALDALLRVYPDALVIQTHRDPRTAIASVCSLAAQATAGWSATFRGNVIGRDQLETWAGGLEEFTEARARHDPARFYDVVYDDFVANPLETVASVYQHFGLRLGSQAEDAMRVLCEQSGDGREARGRDQQSGGGREARGRDQQSGGGREARGREKQSRGAAGPVRRYALSDFGLTGAQVDERFSGYLRARA